MSAFLTMSPSLTMSAFLTMSFAATLVVSSLLLELKHMPHILVVRVPRVYSGVQQSIVKMHPLNTQAPLCPAEQELHFDLQEQVHALMMGHNPDWLLVEAEGEVVFPAVYLVFSVKVVEAGNPLEVV